MQDIHSIGGERLFSGGGDRRLRPHHHHHHQALKCPRCDSLNTKFCYYNNYNLSQPRHFCKSCRRYWTKGGVLRNVPVGGGCRKAKRNSKPKPTSETSAQTQTQTLAEERERKTNSHSSCENSSTLTVRNNTTNVEAVTSVHSSISVSNIWSTMNDNSTKFFGHERVDNGNNSKDPGFEPAATALLEQGSSDCGVFSEIGSFTYLITSSNEALPFGFSNLLNNAQHNLEHVENEQWQQHQQQEQRKMVSAVSSMGGHQELKTTSELPDQKVHVELSGLPDRSGNGGFGSLDWQGSSNQGLFDLPNAVAHASYWSQSTQWTDQEHSSLFP